MGILKLLGIPSKEEIISAIADEVETRISSKLNGIEDDLVSNTNKLTETAIEELQSIKMSLKEVVQLFHITSSKKKQSEIKKFINASKTFLK